MAHLFVAIPSHSGQVTIEHLHSVVALADACEKRGVGLTVEILEGDHVVERARARLAKRFLETPEATHLFFIDADIAFRPENAFRLLQAERDLVGGVYPVKKLDWDRIRAAALAGAKDIFATAATYVVRFLPNAANAVDIQDGFAEVAAVGTGFMLIRRAVVERVAAAHPELTQDLGEEMGGPTAMVFEPMHDPDTAEHLSEDYAFCWRWRALGGQVFADAESRLSHVGHAVYTGSLIEALKPS